jgi:thiamine pyrophosphokinase
MQKNRHTFENIARKNFVILAAHMCRLVTNGLKWQVHMQPFATTFRISLEILHWDKVGTKP